MNAMGNIRLGSFNVMMPEFYILAVTLILLVYGVYRLQRANSFLIAAVLLALGFALAMAVKTCGCSGAITYLMNDMFYHSFYVGLVKQWLIAATMLIILLASGWLKEEGGRPFESVILMLFALVGMMLMISANDLLSLYMSLEMSSLALYVLASFNRDHAKSSEAGLKYFVLGALASGMMLFGMSLVYGFAGSTNFNALAELLSQSGGDVSKGVIVGVVLVIIGFCFKLSAAPFHMWTPDVYEGAPTPVTAFFATVPKIAALVLFARVMLYPFGALVEQWQQVVVAASALSMFVGALAAIMQTNIKRLLAYSSIGHAGFMLMGLSAANTVGVQAMLIYIWLYVFMNAGAFGCVMLMKRGGKPVEEIKDLSGLAQTNPLLAATVALFMFSMAGIPPLAGFFGKFYVVMAAIESGLVWLAIAGMVASVIGCYYYIKVVKVMYFDPPAGEFDKNADPLLRLALIISAGITAFFFLAPSLLVSLTKNAAWVLLN